MGTLKQFWQKCVGKSPSAFATVPEPEEIYRRLLRQLPIVPRDELHARLKRVTPPQKEGILLAGWSNEMSLSQVIQRARYWEQGLHSYERTEGPLVLQGVAEYPAVFRRKHSEAGRADYEIYRVAHDRYIEWEREENYGHGRSCGVPSPAKAPC